MTRYATLSDLYTYGAPSVSFGSLSDAAREEGLDAASEEADGYLRARGTLPLLAWSKDLRQKVAAIAAYELMSRVGFNPGAGADANFLLRANAARDWLKGVSRGEIVPGVTFSSAAGVMSQPQVRSKPLRGI